MAMRLFRPSLRPPEIVLAVYFLYVVVVAAIHPVEGVFPRVAIVNLLVVGGYAALTRPARGKPRPFAALRDWLPVGLIILAYKEMGWFAPAFHTNELEAGWILWDRLLLDDWGLRAAVESVGSLGPSVLEIAYALVYAIGPVSVAVFYAYGKRSRLDAFLLPFVLGTLLAYAFYPFVPSEPPRTVFPGQDLPAVETVFRRFNLWLLSGGGIHTSVFPSGHVAHAFAAAWGMLRALPEHKWVGRTLMTLAVLILVATIYGRYHYAVDSLAGLAVAMATIGISELFYRRNPDSRYGAWSASDEPSR